MKKQKPLLSREHTRTLLTTVKMTTVTGVLSLTLAGWGLLAKADAKKTASTAPTLPAQSLNRAVNVSNQPQRPAKPSRQIAAAPTPTVTAAPTTAPTTAPAKTTAAKIKLNVVQWVNDSSGNRIAVVQDNRGNLWLVMGTDVPRIEQGLQPEYQPQLWQQFGFSRGS